MALRVCFNTCSFAFDCPGGGEVQFLRTRDEVVRLGVEVELYDQWNPRLSSFDLVHFFTVQQGMASFCEYVKSRGLPLILSPIFWPPLSAQRSEMWEIEKMLRLADLVLPNSAAEVDMLVNLFDQPREKFHVVHNGIDPTFLKQVDPNLFRQHVGLTEPFLLCVGNIEPRKNQLAVLEQLESQGIKIPLVCIGHIRDQSYHDKCLSHGNQYRYLGPLPYGSDLLNSAYRAANAFVLVSLFETPGLAALEAICLGCPVLITERGSTVEYFGNQAIYADPEDQTSIRSGLAELVEMVNRGERVKFDAQRFTWAQTADQTIAAYNRALGRRN